MGDDTQSDSLGAGADKSCAEESEAPERVATVHHAAAEQVLGAVGFDIHHDFDRPDDKTVAEEDAEENERRCGEAGQRDADSKRNDAGHQRGTVPDAIEKRTGESQREERAQPRAEQCSAQCAFAHAHGGLDVAKARENPAKRESVDKECAVDSDLRRQVETEAHRPLCRYGKRGTIAGCMRLA